MKSKAGWDLPLSLFGAHGGDSLDVCGLAVT